MARPRKQAPEEWEDDQPTYVVEDSQDTLSKAEYEALIAVDNADKDEDIVPSSAKDNPIIEEADLKKDEVTGEAIFVEQQVAGIGGSNKRRLAKVIGDGGEDEAACGKGGPSKKPRAKKKKKPKLSFAEEGTES